MKTENQIAWYEANEAHASNEYFKVRPSSDTRGNRKLFEAGFARAWDARDRLIKYAGRLTDAEIDAIVDSMPGGEAGVLKTWGWRQFARALEAAMWGEGE